MARYLRSVADELTRASDVLDGTLDDKIGYFDEVNKVYTAADSKSAESSSPEESR